MYNSCVFTECPGSPPHTFLGPDCIASSWKRSCEYTCAEGYRKTGVPAKWRNPEEIYVTCINETWVSPYSWYLIRPNEICLAEGKLI